MKIPDSILDIITWKKIKKDEHPQNAPIQIKQLEKQCPDCDLTVKNRTCHHRKHINPVYHWRQKCNSCEKYYNPVTKKFDLDPSNVHAFFSKHFSKKQ